jgi:ABC-type sugar transport system ATPase subunit
MDTVLQLRDITISFGKKTVIDNLSLDLYKGEIVSLLGENGSGKSTLMKLLSA